MTTFAIDTHKTVKNLLARGYSQEQAEGFVEALETSSFITRADLQLELAAHRTSMVQWIAMLMLGQFIATVGTLGGLIAFLV